jgi:hypothetical protein
VVTALLPSFAAAHTSCNVFGNGKGASDSDIAACIKLSINIKAHYAINLS